MIVTEGLVQGQRDIGVNFTDKKPGASPGINKVAVFSNPAEASIPGQRFFQYRGTVNEGTVGKLSEFFFNFVGQFLQAIA